jgi:hypothetical protein
MAGRSHVVSRGRKHTWQCANHIYEIHISRHVAPSRFFMAFGPILPVRSSCKAVDGVMLFDPKQEEPLDGWRNSFVVPTRSRPISAQAEEVRALCSGQEAANSFVVRGSQ